MEGGGAGGLRHLTEEKISMVGFLGIFFNIKYGSTKFKRYINSLLWVINTKPACANCVQNPIV